MKSSDRAKISRDYSTHRNVRRLALTSVGAAVLAALHSARTSADEPVLKEIVVTATRHAVSALSVPQSITAVSGATLDAAGIQDIASLSRSVAGVNYVDKGPYGGTTGSTLVIRGLNSEDTSALQFPSQVVPPVATYVDETPLFANIRLLDVARVEILRGPQGTLYGSGSLGGTIRFVQNAPDPKAFDAKVEAGMSDTDHTDSPNEDVTGILNIPLSSTFAVRLNAGYTNQAGFIDQPDMYALTSSGAPAPANPADLFSPPQTYTQNYTNSYGYRDGRIAALWRPNDGLRVQLSYFYQLSEGNGYPYAAVIYGVDNLESPDHFRETTTDRVSVVPLTVDYDLGFATLTSATSYSRHENHTLDDGTSPYLDLPGFISYYGASPRAMFPRHALYNDKRWTEELRLVSSTAGPFEWVGGLYFSHESTQVQDHDYYPGYNAFYDACAPIYGGGSAQCGAGEYGPLNDVTSVDGIPLNVDEVAVGDWQSQFKETAAYGELTWHATSKWSFTAGARAFYQTLDHEEQTGLLFDGPQYIANSTTSNQWRRAIWKINATYRINGGNLVYATRSEGFRPGSANALPPAEPFANYVTPKALSNVEPDTADNYEIGFKGRAARRVQYSTAIYDVEWKNIQEEASLTPMELGGAVNVGDGYSRGLEAELDVALTDHLEAQLGYTYDATKLTSLALLAEQNMTTPPDVGSALPGTPKNSASLSLQYADISLAGGDLTFAVDGHYRSALRPAIDSTAITTSGYSTFDARTLFTHDQWRYTLYVDNLTNQLGIDSYTDPREYGRLYSAIVSRPRTVGFTIGYWLRGY